MKVSKIPAVIALVFAISALGTVSGAKAGGAEIKLERDLVAAAAAGDVSGKARFEDRDGRRKFSVEVEGFADGEMLDVMIGGTVVGTLTANALGTADLNYDDNFEVGVDDPATRFPANFPALDGGELVQVGPLSGTLQPK